MCCCVVVLLCCAGAFGYFEVTHDITQYCKAKVFSTVGKRTPIAVRFSTVGEWGVGGGGLGGCMGGGGKLGVGGGVQCACGCVVRGRAQGVGGGWWRHGGGGGGVPRCEGGGEGEYGWVVRGGGLGGRVKGGGGGGKEKEEKRAEKRRRYLGSTLKLSLQLQACGLATRAQAPQSTMWMHIPSPYLY